MESKVQFLAARCRHDAADFTMRLEHIADYWYVTRAIIGISQASPTVPGTTSATFPGGLYAGEAYSCPSCSAPGFFQCGNCRRLCCWDPGDNPATCAFCHCACWIDGLIQNAATFID